MVKSQFCSFMMTDQDKVALDILTSELALKTPSATMRHLIRQAYGGTPIVAEKTIGLKSVGYYRDSQGRTWEAFWP